MAEIIAYCGTSVLVDDEDYEYLSQFKWHIQKGTGYAARIDRSVVPKRTVFMHKDVMGNPQSTVDHIHHDRIDNRKQNLRLCTIAQNNYNSRKRKDGVTSKYKGVYLNKISNMYTSHITFKGKRIFLGNYKIQENAAYYYNEKARELFGEFAYLNDLPAEYLPNENFNPGKSPKMYSEYRGVTYCKKDKRYKAKIGHQGKTINIGAFLTARIAAEMYNVFAIEIHGENAILNTFKEAE